MRIALRLENPGLQSDCSELVRLFDAQCAIRLLEEGAGPESDEMLLCQRARGQGGQIIHCASLENIPDPLSYEYAIASPAQDEVLLYKKLFKRGAKTAVFRLLRAYFSASPPWGSLTGIRPTKLVYEMLISGLSEPQILARLTDTFDLRADKAALLLEILEAQSGYREQNPGQSIDIYAGIAFCPGRCSYCAFPSMDIAREKNLIEPYVQALIREIEEGARLLREKGYAPRALYVGGGTPTSIGEDALDRVLGALTGAFPGARELTVEAGRPDTFTPAMAAMLRRYGDVRLSINPQSMNADTLKRIGRGHDPESIERAFDLARAAGFSRVNADLIMGLPGEGLEDVRATLERVAALRPENLTIHTLALKRASKLKDARERYEPAATELVEAMVELGRACAARLNMRPYYLYRQKYMAANLENVGYALEGAQCLYNIDVMEETHSVLAFGAGAISKYYFPAENRLERFANPRSVEQYIARTEELCARRHAFYMRGESGYLARRI